MLKIQSRNYDRILNTYIALRNGVIALLDQSFPGANHLFANEVRNSYGHLKWIDFFRRLWHKDCVAAVSLKSFADTFQKWCKRTGYRFSSADAERIHNIARNKEDLEIRIANERIAKPKLTEEQLLHFLHKFRVLDMSKQSHWQRLIDTFANRIYLYDDKLVIIINHKDGTETITLDDIETALTEAENGSNLVNFAVHQAKLVISGTEIVGKAARSPFRCTPMDFNP